MAEESQDGQEKTEEPSQRKLQKAAEDGKVLSSKEAFVFTSMFAGFMLMFITPMFLVPMLNRWGAMFHFERPDDLPTLIAERFVEIIWIIVLSGLVIGLPLMIVVLATQTVVGGINFAPKALEFKGNRINPLSGLKRIFSSKGLMELAKAILKVVLLMGVAGLIIYWRMPALLQLPSRDMSSAFMVALIEFPTLLGALLIILAIIFAIDYFWQRHVHIQSLRMTKQEQKDEFKQTEGSPEVKAKIRRMQMETANNAGKQQKALDDVPSATYCCVTAVMLAIAVGVDPREIPPKPAQITAAS